MATQSRNPTSDFGTGGTVAYSSGAAGWSLVNDYPDTADPLTSYVTLGTTANSYILYGFSAFTVPTGSTGISVDVEYYDEEPSNGANSSDGYLRVGGNLYASGTTHNPSTTTTSRTKTFANNPKTGAGWTVAQVNGTDGTNDLQYFGVIGPDSSPVHRHGGIRLTVTYTPAPQTFAPDVATATADAYDPTIAATGAVSFAPDVATTTATAYDATIAASGAATFAPDVATATATAYDATIENVSGDQNFEPDVATATAEAHDATTTATGDAPFAPDAATATAEAFDATIVPSGSASFAPDVATATAEAYDATIELEGGEQFLEPDTATATCEAYDVEISGPVVDTPSAVGSGGIPFAVPPIKRRVGVTVACNPVRMGISLRPATVSTGIAYLASPVRMRTLARPARKKTSAFVQAAPVRVSLSARKSTPRAVDARAQRALVELFAQME